jgi:hypothetical protein
MAAFDRQDYTVPEGLYFVPAPFSLPEPAPGVGLTGEAAEGRGTGLSDSERTLLEDSFRAAYIDGLMRGLPLEGVLGGDRVHGWPEAEPLGWAQNWRSGAAYANSWGIPSLILAVQGINMNRAFIVQGPVLDLYGKSAGSNGANGILGYGYPCGDEFFYKGGRAQRFSLGLVTIDGEGQAAFSPQEVPSSLAAPPAETGVFPGGSWAIREDFQSAWLTRIDQNDGVFMSPDGPVRRIAFTGEPWLIRTGRGALEIREIYFQTFEGGREVFILFVSPGLSFRARSLRPPFLDALMGAQNRLLPGAETAEGASAMPQMDLEDRFSRALLQGLSVYGLPLTDPIPGDDEGGPVEAQRFSGGWMRGKR